MYILYSITSSLKNTEHIPIFVKIYRNCTIIDKSIIVPMSLFLIVIATYVYYEYYDMIK